MKNFKSSVLLLMGICVNLLLLLIANSAYSQAIIIDHNCTDLSQVPESWINTVQNDYRVNYAHRSHGAQITEGLQLIEGTNSAYSVATETQSLPTEAGALCIYEGVPSTDYPYPSDYFGEIQGLLNSLPINVSMFSWCDELDEYSEDQVSNYLVQMSALEAANPDVTFIYMTGNAQVTGDAGANRYARNNQIRDYCNSNGKVLYDFADLDCWYNGQQYTVGGIPVENPQYSCGAPGCDGYEWTHTTAESCVNKGNAFWWMMARIAGWEGSGPGPSPGPSSPPISLSCDKEFFSASYDSIVIYADVQATSNFTPYIRFVTPSGGYYYLTSGGALVGWQEPYMYGPLTLGAAISDYTVATFEFSNVTPGTYTLQGALVGSSGIIGGINETSLIVE